MFMDIEVNVILNDSLQAVLMASFPGWNTENANDQNQVKLLTFTFIKAYTKLFLCAFSGSKYYKAWQKATLTSFLVSLSQNSNIFD